MKKISYLIVALCIPLFGWAQDVQNNEAAGADEKLADVQQTETKTDADSAYIKNDFATAIQIYEALLQEGESADLYYNLGNSYYKTGEIGRAILNYERALLLNPSDGDIQANLQIAQARTVDKVEKIPELFFITWYHNVASWMTADSWGTIAIVLFLTSMLSILLFIFSKSSLIKKVGFFTAIIGILMVAVTNLLGSYQKNKMFNQESAIVVAPSVTVRSTPSESGTSLFVIHEGHKVSIKDNSMNSWKEIRLDDGKVGWVDHEAIEII